MLVEGHAHAGACTTLALWSSEMAEELNLDRGGGDVLGGGAPVVGMDPYAQRYGGHQFGNWAGQLGDGRAITLGEVNTENGFLELQLKGSGQTPYSRTADGKAVLRSSIREFLCSEAMHHGVPTTRALSLVTTGEQVVRDVLYNGNPHLNPERSSAGWHRVSFGSEVFKFTCPTATIKPSERWSTTPYDTFSSS